MKFLINKQSDISAHEQLREQIIFRVSTGALSAGDEMPSVRAMSRQLGISPNTVSKVYAELVHDAWLIEHAGTHHTVLRANDATLEQLPLTTLDEVVDRMVDLAQGGGYSLQQLASRIRDRLLEQPPDHMLVVEPDAGMGELIAEEIRGKTGYMPKRCTLPHLRENPASAIGAILVAPEYLSEKLREISIQRRRILSVTYSPLDRLLLMISQQRHPSMVGLVSVSAAGLKTINGMVAPVAAVQHSVHLFLLERKGANKPAIHQLKRFYSEEYRSKDILNTADARVVHGSTAGEEGTLMHPDSTLITEHDLQCIDLLFCDSVATTLIHHKNMKTYQLLSDASLEKIAAADAALRLPKVGTTKAQSGPEH